MLTPAEQAALQAQARAMRAAIDQAAADLREVIRREKAERIAAGRPDPNRINSPSVRYQRASMAGSAGHGLY